jgi:hypothetical protein
MPTPSWQLVIDASILRAAGSEGATHPTSTCSRQLLLNILQICHRAILTDEIKAEWNAHQSRFAYTWRTQMYSQRKIIVNPQTRDCKTLRLAVERFSDVTMDQRMVAKKDFLLIEGALNGDNIILSVDDRSRNVYCLMSAHVRDFANIYWVNPVREFLEISEVLKGNGQLKISWKLDPTRGI